MDPIDILHHIVTALCAAALGFLGGIGWDHYTQQKLVAQCPEQGGKVPTTITISTTGDVRCVYRINALSGRPVKGVLK